MSAVNGPVLDLPAIETLEGEDERRELKEMAAADEYARHLVVAGPLVDQVVGIRLVHAVNTLSNDEQFDDGVRLEAAYRIGLMTGLRLARALHDVPTIRGTSKTEATTRPEAV